MLSNHENDPLKRWREAGFLATILLVLSFPIYLLRSGVISDAEAHSSEAFYTGRQSCVGCHKKENDLWLGSHHDMAMDSATVETVLGNFNNAELRQKDGRTHRMFKRDGKFFVNTDGPDGTFKDFQVIYTFGYTPLQQYLVQFDRGRLQCLPLTWDTEKKRWYHMADEVYKNEKIEAGNWLHWTGQAQNWNGMCADCHSTNLRKNWNPENRSFNTTWSEIDVSCEACHGPASEHLKWAALPEGSRPADVNTGLSIRTRELTNKELLNVCARCHARRTIMSDYNNDNSDLLEIMIPQLITTPVYHADGQINDEDYEYASFTQSKMYEKGIKCSDCHDSHSVKTLKDDNQLCLKCHKPEQYNTPDHHFHKMPEANPAKRLINRGEPAYETGTGAQCVNCHMVGKYYMGNDYRRDHSFRIPRPDLTQKIGTPNACNDCHKDKNAAWSQSFIEKWYGIRKRPHYGETFALAAKGDPSAITELIHFATNELYPLMVRATAVYYLGEYNTAESNNTILKSLSDPESLIRNTAIGRYRPVSIPEFEKAMLPLLNDPVKAVRASAANRLTEVPENTLSQPAVKALNKALEEYRQINLYTSDFPGGNHNLGILEANKGNIDKAIEYYRQALSIDGLFFMSKVNLATLYNQKGMNDEAEKLLRQVLVENPEIYEMNGSMALLLAEMGRTDESRSFFLKAIEKMPENARNYYNLGLLDNSMGRTKEAESSFLKALSLEPGNYDFLYAACTFYLGQKQRERAHFYADKISALFPGNPIGQQLKQAAAGL